jgi:hypothetical protein
VIIIDFEVNGGFKEAGEQQTALEAAIADFVKDNSSVVFHQVDMKERRGDNPPNISKMKFRNS